MSINALLLDGWEKTSTWGVENGTFYAQLTPNGVSDDEGPQVWIAPPQFVVRDAHDLSCTIATETGAAVGDVVAAMRRGAGPEDRQALYLAAPPVSARQSERMSSTGERPGCSR